MPTPKATETKTIPVEKIPELVFTDQAGNKFRLEPWIHAGEYLLRPIPPQQVEE